MKVLFAVGNEKISEAIIKEYQQNYKEIITGKNVYYFNAIQKELQKDKSYDRIIISEDLEAFSNNNYDEIDRFIFGKLDNISDEAANNSGEDIPIILICNDRRNKSETFLVKIFGIGIYNALMGQNRSIAELCKLLNKPRTKKEAKIYYKIESEDVDYKVENEEDVSETEIQNIINHYKKLGKNEEKYIESFNSIATQYTDAQLRLIAQFLPLNVKAVLEARCEKYQKIVSYGSSRSSDGKNKKIQTAYEPPSVKVKKIPKKVVKVVEYKDTTFSVSEVHINLYGVTYKDEKSVISYTQNGTFTLELLNSSGSITWSSNNEKIATVSNGVITAKAVGSCTVMAKCGGKTFKCPVTVTNYSNIDQVYNQRNIYIMLSLVNKDRVKTKVKPLLVGGGVGTAPMLMLGAELVKMGCTPAFLLGARSSKDLLQLENFEKLGEVYTTTEDGSMGEKGYVTQHSVLHTDRFDMIYTCGPKPMMVSVAKYAKAHGIECEVSLENRMACGVGACLCCVENTDEGHLCVCKEGPVFNIKKLLWQI